MSAVQGPASNYTKQPPSSYENRVDECEHCPLTIRRTILTVNATQSTLKIITTTLQDTENYKTHKRETRTRNLSEKSIKLSTNLGQKIHSLIVIKVMDEFQGQKN